MSSNSAWQPSQDVTTGKDGWYIFVDSNFKNQNKKARLRSIPFTKNSIRFEIFLFSALSETKFEKSFFKFKKKLLGLFLFHDWR